MVGPACVSKDLAGDPSMDFLNLGFAGLLRLCLEVAVFSTGWGLGWKQVVSDEAALSSVGCWIRIIPTD